jgi:L-ribulose-5-phosphate 3-epimerase UlaE
MEVIERSMDEACAVHVMSEWLKVFITKAMEVIERSMDEADTVHVMLEWSKVCNTKAMEVIERKMEYYLSLTILTSHVQHLLHPYSSQSPP